MHLAATSSSAAATTNGSVEELPGLTGSELGAVGATGVGNVATTVSDPGNGLAAALVGSLDVVLSTGTGVVDVLLLASVGSDPLVAKLAAEVNSENVVSSTVDSEVGDGGVSTVAARELSTGDDCDSSEVVGSGASDAVAHGSTVAPAGSKDLLLVNAKVVLGKLEHLVGKGDILTTLVGPTSVETVGGNEDGRVTRKALETVEATLGNVVHVTITPVVTENKSVRLVVLVVVGKLEDVLAVLAVDLHGLGAAGLGSLATAS
jgi:hypothetical protein